jgi:hypothetical protein
LLLLIDEMVREECKRLQMERGDFRFSRRDVRAFTGWGDTQLKVHLHRLEELEYLHPSGRVVTTGFDAANRPNSLASGSTPYLSSLTYAAHRAPASYLYGNSVNRTQSFNSRLPLAEITDWLTSGGFSNPLLDLTYTYGQAAGYNNGDPTSIAVITAQTPGGAQTNFSQSYAYDAFNHLCAAAEGVTLANCSSSVTGSSWAQQFGYDQYGNISGTSTGSGIPALPSGSYNLQNQLTGTYTFGSTGSVPFDCSGNQRTRGLHC